MLFLFIYITKLVAHNNLKSIRASYNDDCFII